MHVAELTAEELIKEILEGTVVITSGGIVDGTIAETGELDLWDWSDYVVTAEDVHKN